MTEIDLEITTEMITNKGVSLHEMAFHKPLMIIFLRHFGCVFCKEALKDLAKKREGFEKDGFELVFVHMSDTETATAYFNQFNLGGIAFVNDPEQRFYRSFGLFRGSFNQLYGLQTWIRGYKVKKQHGFELELAKKLGDSNQMPGVFVLMDGEIKARFIHRHAAEQPNYEKLLECCQR